jgi:hypothetical protein
MTDDPTDLSEERRRRKPLSEIQKALAVIEGLRAGDPPSAESSRASELLRGIDIGEKSTEQRFQMAMLNINLDPAVRRAIQEAYETLKPDHYPEKSA